MALPSTCRAWASSFSGVGVPLCVACAVGIARFKQLRLSLSWVLQYSRSPEWTHTLVTVRTSRTKLKTRRHRESAFLSDDDRRKWTPEAKLEASLASFQFVGCVRAD